MKTIRTFLTITLLLSFVVLLPVKAQNVNIDCKDLYSDVLSDNKFCPYIEFLYHQGVLSGNENFNPNDLITRGQAAKVIVQAFQLDENTSGEGFPDVGVDHTFFRHIMTLKNAGVIDGFPDGQFKPDEKVTRGAILKMIVNAVRIKEPDAFPASDRNINEIFPDMNSNHTFGSFVRDAYIAAEGNQEPVTRIISGYSDGTFRPDQQMTRAEVTKVVANTMKHFGIQSVECELFYCQDRFTHRLGVEVFSGSYFTAQYERMWQKQEDVMNAIRNNHSNFGSDFDMEILALKSDGAEAVFFAVNRNDLDGLGYEVDKGLNAIGSEFKQKLEDNGLTDLATGETAKVKVHSQTMENNRYRIKLEVERGINNNSGKIFGYYEIMLNNRALYFNSVFSEKSDNYSSLERLLTGFNPV